MNRIAFCMAAFTLASGLAGCSGTVVKASSPPARSPLEEGIIFSLEYQQASGTGGFTRANNAKAVPGGNGSWSVDAYGKLYENYLVVTYPQRNDLGPQVFPSHRIVSVQFGDGGIKKVTSPAL